MTGNFEVISVSAPHIYHSALVLAPKNSVVWKLYQSHVHPFARVVHGGSASRDTSTAAITCPSEVWLAVWSPCNRLIAITYLDAMTVDVLDSVTLQRLQTLEPPMCSSEAGALAFSPDSRILTYSSGTPEHHVSKYLSIVSWDLQTGGVVGVVEGDKSEVGRATERDSPKLFDNTTPSITHSADGKVVGVSRIPTGYLNAFSDIPTISIFDVASGICVCSHSAGSGILLPDGIWIQGDSLWFATSVATTVTIWEVGLTSHTAPVVVETLHAPVGIDSIRRDVVLFLPATRRLAFACQKKVQIWDARNSKSLLYPGDARFLPNMSFSSDGRIFACRTFESGIYLWRETPAGYVLHNVIPYRAVYSGLLLSRNGESIVAFGGTIRLWHTKCTTAPPSNVLTQAPQRTGIFVLDFSPDGILAVAAMQKDDAVMVLDLESGVVRSTTNVGMEVYGLRVIGNFVAVIGEHKITRWTLPAGDSALYSGANLKSSSWTMEIALEKRSFIMVHDVSVSPNFCYAAFVEGPTERFSYLRIYSVFGEKYRYMPRQGGVVPWFTPDGIGLWFADEQGVAKEWKIVTGKAILELSRNGIGLGHPPAGYPWASSRGYQVTKDWWIRGPDGKRLLMLPPHWQSDAVRRVWKGQFLALLHRGPPEPVILELLNS